MSMTFEMPEIAIHKSCRSKHLALTPSTQHPGALIIAIGLFWAPEPCRRSPLRLFAIIEIQGHLVWTQESSGQCPSLFW